MYLKIKPQTDDLVKLYSSHSHYNVGDSGLDIFFPDTIIINPDKTVCIDLKRFQCEAFHQPPVGSVERLGKMFHIMFILDHPLVKHH